ncbi:MAG: hypothetical protein [Avonheates virus SG_479]|uniref:hypothetical protein n=1 Tax=Avonheates virus SG_479 TaxID=2914485 RepID=UPI002481C0F9|nr:MAG: hypothetical protein QKV65_gp1 [Avonheates virus SG_479]UNI72636.1 MAG: hypothetical protein [Avonheates virus SG_479]
MKKVAKAPKRKITSLKPVSKRRKTTTPTQNPTKVSLRSVLDTHYSKVTKASYKKKRRRHFERLRKLYKNHKKMINTLILASGVIAAGAAAAPLVAAAYGGGGVAATEAALTAGSYTATEADAVALQVATDAASANAEMNAALQGAANTPTNLIEPMLPGVTEDVPALGSPSSIVNANRTEPVSTIAQRLNRVRVPGTHFSPRNMGGPYGYNPNTF